MEKDKQLILWFDQISIDDVQLVGGKNASLGEMYRTLTPKGVNIPNGFAVTALAYRSFLDKSGVTEKIKQILSDLNTSDIKNLVARGKNVRETILQAELPEELKNSKGYTGVAELALHSSSPIVPIAIQNLEGAFPTKKFIPRHLPKVTVRIGRPIYFKKYYNQHKNKKIIRIVTNKVMKEIKKLYKKH